MNRPNPIDSETPPLDQPVAQAVAQGPRLGPDSLVWKYVGDWRVQLFGFQRIAITQNAIDEVGQAIEEHSVFFSDFKGRIDRTMLAISSVIYAEDAGAWGHKIRDFHTDVKGSMPDGSRYHALSPELFYWIHATFVDFTIYTVDTFIRRLSDAEKEQLYQESKDWYARYGVTERAQPQTYAEFLEYWDAMTDKLVSNRTVRYGSGYLRRGLPKPRTVPAPLWPVLSAPLNAYLRTMGVGVMPPQAREVCGLTWDDKRERRFQRIAAVIRALNPVINRLPLSVLYVPRAAEAFQRAGTDPRKIHN
ncbi:oxygenase MpaB family protein [Nocardia huaxiensis]|uniref:oxygenase MpaB family protein n=1 Tax=Nocardia huaxiensis TaxID=2755382 RepID=UPI001E320097|nr:oxygenase MpaB family protein [Nocardia huaxiensis]UFS98547.1 DUF2236 domain-containing protein [Nocardia huaxiensis]